MKALLDAQRDAAVASRRVDDARSLEILLKIEQDLLGKGEDMARRAKRVGEMIDDVLNIEQPNRTEQPQEQSTPMQTEHG